MTNIINFIIKLFNSKIISVIITIFDAVKAFFSYKNNSIIQKNNEKIEKSNTELDKKIDNITKNGTIEDLLNIRNKQ